MIGETHHSNNEAASSTPSTAPVSDSTHPCECTLRMVPPPRPTSLPFPSTEENRERLEKWILDYYKSSTFNVCEHQPLPMMSAAPPPPPPPAADGRPRRPASRLPHTHPRPHTLAGRCKGKPRPRCTCDSKICQLKYVSLYSVLPPL